jgi:SAM-dependent methyltransferase
MHDTAMEIAKKFFDVYAKTKVGAVIVDIGSLDVNGSLRAVAPVDCKYVGLDFATGKGVDVVITDPYSMPLEDNYADMVVCSSVFEHSEFFWLLFNEIQRILKPDGVCYLNIPSNGLFHRYPVDCWRAYPDSGVALQNWARRSGYDTALLESFTGVQKRDVWNDFVAVFVKDSSFVDRYPARIVDSYSDFTNGLVFGSSQFRNQTNWPEDKKLFSLPRIRYWLRKAMGKLGVSSVKREGATARS